VDPDLVTPADDESQSAVSWQAVFAGAVAALALSIVLASLAAGFGLRLVSPWPSAHAGFSGFTPVLGAWTMTTQVLSSALGGYLAGRLRTKWLNVHTHEVHFRDTAHGLLVWAVATVAGAALVATVLAQPLEVATAVADLDPALLQLQATRSANLAAQASLFMGIGLLLGAFVASVAAAIGGLRRDQMHAVFWDQRRIPAQPASR
jgi:MFS family permease